MFEKDTDAYARDRDEQVRNIAKDAGVEVIVRYGRTLWDSDELVKKNGNKPTMSITAVMKVSYTPMNYSPFLDSYIIGW